MGLFVFYGKIFFIRKKRKAEKPQTDTETFQQRQNVYSLSCESFLYATGCIDG